MAMQPEWLEFIRNVIAAALGAVAATFARIFGPKPK